MIILYKISRVIALCFLIMFLSVFSIWQLNTEIAYSQKEQIEDDYGSSLDNDSDAIDSFDSTQPQNPDPEFMEEVEPGEYNQSDDTTELNDNY